VEPRVTLAPARAGPRAGLSRAEPPCCVSASIPGGSLADAGSKKHHDRRRRIPNGVAPTDWRSSAFLPYRNSVAVIRTASWRLFGIASAEGVERGCAHRCVDHDGSAGGLHIPIVVAFAMKFSLSRGSTVLPWQPVIDPALPS
jgi:hypothetical protein